MGTTIFPMGSSGPDDLGYHGDAVLPSPIKPLTESQLRRLLESKKKPKQIIKEAMGTLSKGKKKKPKTYRSGKNLATEAKGKRGPFGQKVQTPLKGKGIRVAESDRKFERGVRKFREAVSAEDTRRMLSKALSQRFPEEKLPGGGIDWQSRPSIRDVYPEDHMVVFEVKEVLYGADYKIDEDSGKATVTKIRKVKMEPVPLGGDDGED